MTIYRRIAELLLFCHQTVFFYFGKKILFTQQTHLLAWNAWIQLQHSAHLFRQFIPSNHRSKSIFWCSSMTIIMMIAVVTANGESEIMKSFFVLCRFYRCDSWLRIHSILIECFKFIILEIRDVDRTQCKNKVFYSGCLSEWLMRECGWKYTYMCSVFVTHSCIRIMNAIANKIVYNFQFWIVMRISGFQQSEKMFL